MEPTPLWPDSPRATTDFSSSAIEITGPEQGSSPSGSASPAGQLAERTRSSTPAAVNPSSAAPPEAAPLGRPVEHAWALKRAHALKEQLQRLAGVPDTESAAQACSAELTAILAEFPTLPQALAAPL